MKKDLSWWDYNKHQIIITMIKYSYMYNDKKNVEWKIWHHDKTTEEFFSNLKNVETSESTLTREGRGYYIMNAIDKDEKIDIIFRYKGYELIKVDYFIQDNNTIYKEYERKK